MRPTQLILILIALLLGSCTNPSPHPAVKHFPGDPFASSMVESQFYAIEGSKDKVIRGTSGTLMVFPEGCFLNKEGKVVNAKIEIELAEALSLGEMLRSNLTTIDDKGNLLETGGMIYINATSNGESLFPNPQKPPYIEIPTPGRKPGMRVYTGIRDSTGNMTWKNPKPLENYLVTVPFEDLDFYPPGFENAVRRNLPFRGHTEATRDLVDSLYFSTTKFAPGPLESEVVEGEGLGHLDMEEGTEVSSCGVDPATIKLIRTDAYQNTFFATSEFEARLQKLFPSPVPDLIEVYLNNLNQDLWVSDSLVAARLTGPSTRERQMRRAFRQFSSQKLSNVNAPAAYANLIRAHYKKELKKIRQEIRKQKKKAKKLLRQQRDSAEKVMREYENLIYQRRSFQAEAYGFNLTTMGWINVDIPVPPSNEIINIFSEVPGQPKAGAETWWEMEVQNPAQMDRVYAYIVYLDTRSLFPVKQQQPNLFFARSSDSPKVFIPEGPAMAVVIGYHEKDIYFHSIDIAPSEIKKRWTLTPKPTSKAELDKFFRQFEGFAQENRIETDLAYQASKYKKQQQEFVLFREIAFRVELDNIAYPCMNGQNGEALFKINCATCHKVDKRLTGPKLQGMIYNYDCDWLFRFVKNSPDMIRKGDPLAVQRYNDYNQQVMQAFPMLSDNDIKAIFAWVEGISIQEIDYICQENSPHLEQ